MGSPLVRARGLAKTYGAGHGAALVLDGTDLDVARGEFVAVIGRSGSGKSTLLHVLGGLDCADAGTIELDGMRLERLDERGLTAVRRRHVGFVFQAFHLLPELTGVENVLPAGATRTRWPRGRSPGAGVDRQLRTPGCSSEAPHRALRRRAAAARRRPRADHNPSLVLADEPTGNLDEESGAAVLDLLRRVADSGRAVVLVAHDPQRLGSPTAC